MEETSVLEQPGSVAVGTPWKGLQAVIKDERPVLNAGSTPAFRYPPINHQDVARIQRTALLGQNVGGHPAEELEDNGKMEMMTSLAMNTSAVRRLAVSQSGVDGDLPGDPPASVKTAQGTPPAATNGQTKEDLLNEVFFGFDPVQATFLGLGTLFLLAGTYSFIRGMRAD